VLNMPKNESFVSVVLVTENDAASVAEGLRQLQRFLDPNFVDYEIVVLDQCSSDGTQDVIASLLTSIAYIRFIELAFRVNDDVALAAALENAIGDFVVLFSAKCDPIACILDVVKQCRSGSDIVVGVAAQRISLPYRLFRPLVRSCLHSIGYDVPRNATRLRCLSRRAVNGITRAGRFHHQLFVRIQKTGYSSSVYHYKTVANPGRKTLRQGVWEVSRLLVFNSTRPLRWMAGAGLLGSGAGSAGAICTVLLDLLVRKEIPGSVLIVLFVSPLLMVLFLMLAFFSEYLGRLLDELGEQHLYSVVYEKNSSVMVDENRVNVLTDSECEDMPLVQTGRNR